MYVGVLLLRALTWNLMHGRAVPPAHRDLLDDFAAAMREWEWDVALLQEVPPWWPDLLGARFGAEQRRVLTSRNALLPIRRAVAVRWPDAIKSNGGGANAILVRGDRIVSHRIRRLRLLPERRWVHAVQLGGGVWVGNLHATVHNARAALDEARDAAASLLAWGGDAPLVLGGDFNVRDLTVDGFVYAGGSDVDHVFVRGLAVAGAAEVLERGSLSDHAPVLVSVAT